MTGIESLLAPLNTILIKQKKEWIEIFSGFESKNKYSITDEVGTELGFMIEEGTGFVQILRRLFLRSHRPFEITILNAEGHRILKLHRKFFWFFSDLFIEFDDKKYGSVHRRFALFSKVYSVLDTEGAEVFKIKSPFYRIWNFPIFNNRAEKVGFITKKWQGFIKESFTDADAFMIRYERDLTTNEKILLFCSGISIDFDYFENNQGSSSLFDFLGN